jgi:flagellar basal body P-ring formation protein FlgA
MSALPIMLPLALQAAPALENLDVLHQRMEAAAGAPVRPLDPRLRLRVCPDAVTIDVGPRAVTASCAVVGWRVHGVPMQSASGPTQPAGPVIRRGDAVQLRVPGRGFAVTLRAVALDDGGIGARIRLRPASGPARAMTATVTGPGEASL